MHKINGKYYLFATLSDGVHRRCQIFSCDAPDGEFIPADQPLTPAEWLCLDATYFEEKGKKYTVFCHEWLQCKDGEMILAELDDDLRICGESKLLFHASDAPWVREIVGKKDCYITDGPHLRRMQNGKLLMLWSSAGEKGYAMGMATAESIEGPWVHAEKPLVSENGGHGMLIERDGETFVVYHLPNHPSGAERTRIERVVEKNGLLEIVK